MKQPGISAGRPRGATTADPVVAKAFGDAVRSVRTRKGVAQEALALAAKIERSHMGKVERGEHMPTLALMLKVAKALGISPVELIAETAVLLPKTYLADMPGAGR